MLYFTKNCSHTLAEKLRKLEEESLLYLGIATCDSTPVTKNILFFQ